MEIKPLPSYSGTVRFATLEPGETFFMRQGDQTLYIKNQEYQDKEFNATMLSDGTMCGVYSDTDVVAVKAHVVVEKVG